MSSNLRPDLILETMSVLQARIAERFPGSSLAGVSGNLREVAVESQDVFDRLARPYWPLRLLAFLGIAVIAFVAVSLGLGVMELRNEIERDLSGYLATIESGINDVVLLSLAIFFLLGIEGRYKRKLALTNLHRLRSIVHIVDMHQLTKDPERLITPEAATPSSPKPTFTRFELTRYLDYCSELLSLCSKTAALHVQYLNDPVVLNAVNDIESLAASLSNSIWQKIMILDSFTGEAAAARPAR